MKTILNIILTRIGMVGRLRGWEVFVSRKGAEGAEFFCQQIKRMKQFLPPRITSIMRNFCLISLILLINRSYAEGAEIFDRRTKEHFVFEIIHHRDTRHAWRQRKRQPCGV